MRLFRITSLEHLDDLSGLGASYQGGGRWNEPGVPALYFAQTASVAMLEMANYLPSPRLVPRNYRLGVFEVDDDIPMDHRTLDEMPQDWRDFPYPQSTQRMGTDWLIRGQAVLLAVPSTVVPGGLENTVLASPSRLVTETIRLLATESEIFNPRAFAMNDPPEQP